MSNEPNAQHSDFEDIKDMTFEVAMAQLEEVVRKLENGSVSLEDSIEYYTRGEALKKHCEAKLSEAEARIEKITLAKDGTPTGVEPFEAG
ncbi:exodeoxyribonuclease VII small subunit [Kordiimonas sp. SCSIO 12610]|uniref:exodeoxyribonuclease VII small subunit n=1 Tax=Kordiimonas sp. SCSIO 12610 TaxID=2829597 RepID=UPI002109CFE5|nr:exodeoxyribonuclease VII small subunit [Kordiimonas sp. SCSIO 12610]UTW56747.1 exodeoxyribonuclease VII small subunit [Kordiimonas sp. SCSIO 12610]